MRNSSFFGGLLTTSMLLSLDCRTEDFAGGATQPNFVFILLDDLRWDALGCMNHPYVQTPNIDRIAKEGALFRNAFTTISVCSPSRAGFLTGTYPQINGVMKNVQHRDPDPSLPNMGQLFQRAGYDTAFVGKWHMKISAEPRSGFDHWLSFEGQGVYINPQLNEDGLEFTEEGYITDILTKHAVDWIKKPHEKPFLLYLSHKAVHEPFKPAERHRQLYLNATLPEPAYWSNTLDEAPEWTRAAYSWGVHYRDWLDNKGTAVPPSVTRGEWPSKVSRIGQGAAMKYSQTLSAVDDGVGQIFRTLEQLGELDNTVIVFASDNGFYVPGVPRVKTDKRVAYEDSIRIPFLLRYPHLVQPGTVIDRMVLNIDLLPTLLDIAGIDVPQNIQGTSFKPLLEGRDVPWRKAFLCEYFMEGWLPGVPSVECVRTENWKYMRYPDIKAHTELYDTLSDMDELYDLKKDPDEMHNLAENPEYKNQLEKLQAELDRLLQEASHPGQIQ